MRDKLDFYYFSGTGNTLIIVNEMYKVFKSHGINVTLKNIESGFTSQLGDDLMIGLAFPINSKAVSPFIWTFFKSLPQAKGMPVFMVDTFNESPAISKALYNLLKKKGYTPIGACEITMKNNLVINQSQSAREKDRVDKGIKEAHSFAIKIVEGSATWLPNNQGSAFVSFLSRNTQLPWLSQRLLFKLNVDQTKCTSCGKCVQLCPVSNIKLVQYPIHKNNCQFCLRCAAFCPVNAVSIKGKEDIQILKSVESL